MPNNNYLLTQLKTYAGCYECHITVDLGEQANTTSLTAFEAACETLGAKVIVIQLSNGQTPLQPMLSKFMQGEAEQIVADINAMRDALARDFCVVRLKVEAGIDNNNIPQTDAAISALAESCYFEHHIKMCLPIGMDLSALQHQLATYHGYVSKNARSIVQNNNSNKSKQEYRFVTQRFRRGNDYAVQQLEALLDFLHTQSIDTQKVIREFNIFDSYADLDAGWMQ